MKLVFGRIVFLVVSFSLAACQSSRPDPKVFEPSEEHLQRKAAVSAEQQVPIPSVNSKAPYLPKPRAKKYNDLYSVSVVQVPVKDVLFKLARDAQLDVDFMDSADALVTLNALDQTLPAIVERLNEQTGLKIVLEERRLVVQADKAYWVNYPIDYVNLDRYTQSSVLLSNSLGNNAQGSSANVSLGGTSAQASALQSGSNVAILNRSRHELWVTLGTGVMRTLRAMYPILSAPLAEGTTGAATSTTPTNSPTTDSSANSAMASIQGLGNAASLPAPEQSLSNAFQPFSPYPADAPVSNYVTLAREAGFIAVYAPSRGQKEVQKYIDQMMSGGRKQVMIEATVVEVELNDDSQSGVNWSALASDGSFSISQAFSGTSGLASKAGLVSATGSSIGQNWSMSSTLKLLERFGNSRVLSSPKMMGINNQPTLLKVVKNLVYFEVSASITEATTTSSARTNYSTLTKTVPVGLVMSILPSISEANEITLVVRPTISTLSRYVPDPNPILQVANLIPEIQEREMESVLKLNDGQIAILGGLIQDATVDEDTGIPGLVGREGIGYLFGQKNKAKSKSELVIFLKPVLVKHPDIENGSFADKKHLLPKLSEQNGQY